MSEYITSFIKTLYNNIFSSINESAHLPSKIIFTVIIFILAFLLSNIIKKYLWNFTNSLKVYTTFRKTILTVMWVATLLILLATWIHAVNSLIVVILIILAVIAFSVKSLSMDIVGWVMLLSRRYFRLYDRIKINELTGDVVKITPFYFKIIERAEGLSGESPTGKSINIPNHILLEAPLTNYNDFTQVNWKEVTYSLVIDSDWQTAKIICEEELASYLKQFKTQYTASQIGEIQAKISLFDGKLDTKTTVLIEDDTINIHCYFPVQYTEGTSTKSYLNERILPRLNENKNIELSGEKIHVNIRG